MVASIAHLVVPAVREDAERIELIQPADGRPSSTTPILEPDAASLVGLPVGPGSGSRRHRAGRVQRGAAPSSSCRPAFTHPVARCIVEQRRLLADQPDQRERVAAAMNSASAWPALKRFQNDTCSMALRSMA
ncbi:MAG: hypothetical protein R3F54_01755 [Alphaproteobacteria bacterium]